MRTPTPYSELEYLVLAMAGENISSGYAMTKEMSRIRGGRWSSESGAVYRVIRRLCNDALLTEVGRSGAPNRERTEYALTHRGEAFLHNWLTSAPDRAEMAILLDPIRTRAFYLSRLKTNEQVRVVRQWISESKALIGELEKETEYPLANRLKDVANSNLLVLARARHEWLKQLLVQVRVSANKPAPDSVAPDSKI